MGGYAGVVAQGMLVFFPSVAPFLAAQPAKNLRALLCNNGSSTLDTLYILILSLPLLALCRNRKVC